MVTEIAQYRAQPGKADELQAALLKGMAVIQRAEGMRHIALRRGIEDPETFHLQIQWETLEHHTVTFRGGSLFPEYRSHLAGLYIEPISVAHYTTIEEK